MNYSALKRVCEAFDALLTRKVISKVASQVLEESIEPDASLEDLTQAYDETAKHLGEAERDKLVLKTVEELEPETVVELADSLSSDEANEFFEQFGEAAASVARGNRAPQGVNPDIAKLIIERLGETEKLIDWSKVGRVITEGIKAGDEVFETIERDPKD